MVAFCSRRFLQSRAPFRSPKHWWKYRIHLRRRRFLDRLTGLPIAGCTRAERWHNGTDWHQGALMALVACEGIGRATA